MRRHKLILALSLLWLALAATGTAWAQEPATAAVSATNAVLTAAPAAKLAEAETLVASGAPTIFNIGPLPVTNSMICTWIVVALIILIVRVTAGKLQEVPGTGQNLMESIIEGWNDLMGNVLEPKVVKWVFPFAMTFFLFIVISNLIDLVPGVGSIGWVHGATGDYRSVRHVETPFFRPPTSDANLTVAMAAIFFVMSLYWAVRYIGPLGLIKHVFGVKVDTNKWLYIPLLLLFIFIGIMESFSILFIRPVALALRLYGNIFGGETMLTMAMSQKSALMAVLLAMPGYFFETFVCVLQAFVFAMLSVAFVGTLCTHADEEHGH